MVSPSLIRSHFENMVVKLSVANKFKILTVNKINIGIKFSQQIQPDGEKEIFYIDSGGTQSGSKDEKMSEDFWQKKGFIVYTEILGILRSCNKNNTIPSS
jgi:hypothetical protein